MIITALYNNASVKSISNYTPLSRDGSGIQTQETIGNSVLLPPGQ